MATDHLPAEVLDDVVELLIACPAFVGVPRDHVASLAAEAEIAYVDQITTPTLPALVVQRGGLVVRDDADRTVDMVGQGEFSAPSDDERLDPVEPTMVVWLPERAIDLAWSAQPDQLSRLLDRPARSIDLQTAPVRTVMRAPVHTALAGEACAAVAARMTAERISSMVVLDDERTGIVTDRDLRSRLVAQDRPPSTPVGDIATWPVRTVTARTPVFEVLIEMLAMGIHHLPVTEDARLVGMVDANDVLELGTRSPLHLRSAIDRADSVDGVARVLENLPDTVRALLAAGTKAGDVGRVIATVTDRVQQRLLALAFGEYGDAPTDFGWIAFGSQARREQTLHSDQDHGLVLPDGSDEEAWRWWGQVASWMVDALERCGYTRCNGDVMASNEAWRHDVSGWRAAFGDWIQRPTEHHLMESSIAFDLRSVAGGLQVRELMAPVIATVADRGIFLGRLARDATRHRPPLGFFGRFAVERSGDHRGSFDIKAGVMVPIADIARLHALARGSTDIATDDRLTGAAVAGQLSDDLSSTLRSGYELATGLRLRRHLDQHDAGRPLDNWLDPDDLEALVRAQLRATFKAIRTAQQSIESRYQTGMLG
jgi:CBS domain-containing protein